MKLVCRIEYQGNLLVGHGSMVASICPSQMGKHLIIRSLMNITLFIGMVISEVIVRIGSHHRSIMEIG